MKNSGDFQIDLNAKINDGRTGFHLACWNGPFEIAKILMTFSNAFQIDLNATGCSKLDLLKYHVKQIPIFEDVTIYRP